MAVAVHGTVLGSVHALGLSMVGEGFNPHSSSMVRSDDVADADLKASCAGNVMLATSGRTAMCFAPWVRDVDECLGDAQMMLWMDLSSCQARNDPSTAISMVEQRAVEKLKPIDPEQLIDEMQAKRTPSPPKAPAPTQLAEGPKPPPPPTPQRPQQVIETVKPSEDKEPENARFLAEYNTKVAKETVARGARNEPMVARSKPEELTPKDKPKDDPSVKKQELDRLPGKNEHAPDVPGKLSMRNPGALSPAEHEQEAKVRGSATGAAGEMVTDGYLARKGDSAIAQDRHDRSEAPRGEAGAGGGAPQVPQLKPSEEVLERAVGGGSVDHLENVDNSDETSLSAKRWVYASFFNRLKRQVAQNWDPGTVWRRSDPTGTVYGFKTRVTEVRVSLTRKGEVDKILVTTPSGVTALDDEAVRAFRSAGPFPNPPDGLFQKDNLITFGFAF
ncbi:MAG TPA: TonB family protein, partial [Kofleriaceae bacterium]|nr:TonB family protein [Kofleriaceae bacterium]